MGFYIRGRLCYRYRVTILRHEFEQNRHVKDHEQIKTLIQNAEEQLFLNKNPTPLKCKYFLVLSYCYLALSTLLTFFIILLFCSRQFTRWSSLRKRTAVSRLGPRLLEPRGKGSVSWILCQAWATKERVCRLLGAKVWSESRRASPPSLKTKL